MLLKCIQALLDGFQITREDRRPIGLKSFDDFSNDELLAQLSRPTSPIPKFRTSFRKQALASPTPVFAQVNHSPFAANSPYFPGQPVSGYKR